MRFGLLPQWAGPGVSMLKSVFGPCSQLKAPPQLEP